MNNPFYWHMATYLMEKGCRDKKEFISNLLDIYERITDNNNYIITSTKDRHHPSC